MASAFGVRLAIDRTVPYDVAKDFSGVGQMARSPSFLVVSPSHGFKSLPEFAQQPQVIDGASDLFFELFGPQAGQHARSAVGHVALPRGIAVEINGEFELHPAA